MSIVMISSTWCTAEPKPQWVCIVHEGGFSKEHLKSAACVISIIIIIINAPAVSKL